MVGQIETIPAESPPVSGIAATPTEAGTQGGSVVSDADANSFAKNMNEFAGLTITGADQQIAFKSGVGPNDPSFQQEFLNTVSAARQSGVIGADNGASAQRISAIAGSLGIDQTLVASALTGATVSDTQAHPRAVTPAQTQGELSIDVAALDQSALEQLNPKEFSHDYALLVTAAKEDGQLTRDEAKVYITELLAPQLTSGEIAGEEINVYAKQFFEALIRLQNQKLAAQNSAASESPATQSTPAPIAYSDLQPLLAKIPDIGSDPILSSLQAIAGNDGILELGELKTAYANEINKAIGLAADQGAFDESPFPTADEVETLALDNAMTTMQQLHGLIEQSTPEPSKPPAPGASLENPAIA